VRGGLDDALERLARMDQLRRRAGSSSGGSLPTAHGLAEAIEAVRRVVERYPDLNITLYGEQGEGSAEVRIGWEDGLVRAKIISVEGPEAAGFGQNDGPMPVLPAEIPPMTDLPRPITDASRPRVDAYPAARRAEPPPVPEAPRLVDPSRLADRRRRRSPAPEPATWSADAAPAPWPGSTDPAAWAEPARAEEPQQRTSDLPIRSTPRAWHADQEDASNAAARLAAMIREDPSLLSSPDDR